MDSEGLRDVPGAGVQLTAHDGLWESAWETADSLEARLAVEHCVHEVRRPFLCWAWVDWLVAFSSKFSLCFFCYMGHMIVQRDSKRLSEGVRRPLKG